MIILHRREFRMHLHNIRQAWSWKLHDVKWLLLIGPASFSKRLELPHQGKFNAAEKINFMVLMSTYPVYVITGLTIWFFRPAFVSWLVHFSLATLATPLILGHIFMATINPDTRVGLKGMFTGFVNREWARHHYRLWYDEHFGHHDRDEDATQPFPPVAAAAPLPSAEVVLTARRPAPALRVAPAQRQLIAAPRPAGAVVRASAGAPRPLVTAHRPTAGAVQSAAAVPTVAAAAEAEPADGERGWIVCPSPSPAGAGANAWSLRPLRHHALPDGGAGGAD
jgi:cytochrome b subunit of formate dehydrogenase